MMMQRQPRQRAQAAADERRAQPAKGRMARDPAAVS
jgi:hypothetical protein